MANGKLPQLAKQPAKPIGLKVIRPQAHPAAAPFGGRGYALAAGVAANAGPLVAIGALHAVKKKPPAKSRRHSQAGAVTTDDSTVNAMLTAPPSASPAGSDYASGQTGGGAAGYGSNYGTADNSGAYSDPYAGAAPPDDGSGSATALATTPAVKPAAAGSSHLWLWIGGGVALAVVGYGYFKYRQITWPIRKFRQIRRAANGLISTVKA